MMKAGMIVPVGDPVQEPADFNQNRYVIQNYSITQMGKVAAKKVGPIVA